MKVTRISKYGFQVDNSTAWNNWDKEYTNHPKLKLNDNVDFEKTKDGYVNKVVINEDLKENIAKDSQFRSPDEIIRGECLTNAVSLMQYMGDIRGNDPVVTTVEVAKVFENYIKGQ